MNSTFSIKSNLFFLLMLSLSVWACKGEKHEQGDHDDHMNQEMHGEAAVDTVQHVAKCVVYPTVGNSVSGTVTFMSTPEGTKVDAVITGLTPGKHGFHIHQFGDCSAADGTSAGGHFNPDNHDHGNMTDAVRHVGDLGNLEADASGTAALSFVDATLKFTGDHSIIGHSIIIHEKEDDLKTQPTGNAGARVACGVIGLSK